MDACTVYSVSNVCTVFMGTSRQQGIAADCVVLRIPQREIILWSDCMLFNEDKERFEHGVKVMSFNCELTLCSFLYFMFHFLGVVWSSHQAFSPSVVSYS